jgi:hypothetical protein
VVVAGRQERRQRLLTDGAPGGQDLLGKQAQGLQPRVGQRAPLAQGLDQGRLGLQPAEQPGVKGHAGVAGVVDAHRHHHHLALEAGELGLPLEDGVYGGEGLDQAG